jgi:DNA-binding PadR family transcriptional regulator
MKQTDFHILLALADADRHGYGIMQEVEDRSNGEVRLGPGTLYGAIKRLIDCGWIVESTKRPSSGDDQRRRCYYHLTRSGRQAVAGEAQRLAGMVRVAEAKSLVKARKLAPGA